MEMTRRPRRLRGNETLRKMVRETRMDKSSLIYPIFVKDGKNIKEEIPSMEGQFRYSVDQLPYALEEIAEAGVSSVMLFGIPEHKDEMGSQAYAEDGIVQRALREAKSRFRTSTTSQMSACASILHTDTAECCAAMRWKMTPRWSCCLRLRCPMCRLARIWSLLPI